MNANWLSSYVRYQGAEGRIGGVVVLHECAILQDIGGCFKAGEHYAEMFFDALTGTLTGSTAGGSITMTIQFELWPARLDVPQLVAEVERLRELLGKQAEKSELNTRGAGH